MKSLDPRRDVRDAPDTSFDAFARAVRESIEKHAERKNYHAGNFEENPLALFLSAIGIFSGHNIGEIIYKAVEYVKTPRRVLLEKIAGWAWLEWRNCKE